MKFNKKTILIIGLAAVLLIIVIRFGFGSNEDTWVCENNKWVRHGFPVEPKPTAGCGDIVDNDSNSTDGQKIVGDNPIEISETDKPEVYMALESEIAKEFAKKYNRNTSDYILSVQEYTGKFATGSVGLKDEMGGGLWFAAYTDNGWELAFDGNGLMTCDVANKYEFPSNMVPGCIDTANNDEFVNR